MLESTPFKRGNEGPLTYSLKWAAWEWLYTFARCRCVGMEVKLEGPGGRIVDLVGIGPENTIYIVEVKATLADFSRDNHTYRDLEALRAQAAVLERRANLVQDILTQATSHAKRTQGDTWEQSVPYLRALTDFNRESRYGSKSKRRCVSSPHLPRPAGSPCWVQ